MIQLCANVTKFPLDLLKRTRHIVQPASKIVLFFRSLITSHCRKAKGNAYNENEKRNSQLSNIPANRLSAVPARLHPGC